MKFISTLIALFLSLVLITSCSNELDLTADYEEVTVVYGVLDTANTKQYIRIMKGYLDPETSAVEQAQIQDSIYYPSNLIAKLTERETGTEYDLERVNGDTLNPPVEKEEGIFANTPNILYVLRSPIKKGNTYDLYIENPNTGKVITSSAPVLGRFAITFPPVAIINQFLVSFYQNSRGLEIQWTTPKFGKTYDLQIGFNYLEWDKDDSKSNAEEKTIRFTTATGLISNTSNGGESITYYLEGDVFFSRIAGLIDENPNLLRAASATPFDIRVNAGEEELYRYILINNTLLNDITQLSAKPEYTNINNGIGIFTSKASIARNGIAFSGSTLDSLSCGKFTIDLNFEGPCQ